MYIVTGVQKKLERIKEERVTEDRSCGFTEDVLFELTPKGQEGPRPCSEEEHSRPKEQQARRPEVGTRGAGRDGRT